MKVKILGVFICALIFLSVINAGVTTEIHEESSVKQEYQYAGVVVTSPTTTVWLKFFVHRNCTKNISEMVADCNDIFDGGNSGSRSGGITQFATNGTVTDLPDSAFDNINTSVGRMDLLRKLKSEQNNCSNGINVVIVPNGHFTSNGITYFNKGTGTNDKPYGGIILRDTCNQDQMNKTLAHELLHALGLSHEQVKWFNSSSNQTESKPIGSTIVNGAGPGTNRTIPASACGFPVPPHGYAYYDKDGDCDCEDNDEEQPEDDAGRKIWDIDGNCVFGEANDTGTLLWGRADRTNTTILPGQREAIFDNANSTPGYRQQTTGQNVSVPQNETSKSKSFKDVLGDVVNKFIDILGGIVSLYYDHHYIYLGLELDGYVPDEYFANYYYYIDKDNDVTTGNPQGYDYLVDLLVRPYYKVSALSAWDPYYGIFKEVTTLDWDIAVGAEDSEDDGDCNEYEMEGMVIRWMVPLELLSMELTGDMRIVAVTKDEMGRTMDTGPEVLFRKTRATVPVLNLNSYSGNPGDTVICFGYDFTPLTGVTIAFDCKDVKTAMTDANGEFTTTFIVPPTAQGYYTVNAYDMEGKFHVRLFMVENQPPNKPSKPMGKTAGRVRVEYTYESTTIDPEGDQIWYWFDWGDGQNSGWVGPYTSGQT
ncbi:MAG: hypothetical protein KKC68_00145, partial [Candidatus Thermoplasmatota archaeon]|nr:hypothetical protein [Candidatus Thermoplasmatota archaeon]